MSLDKGQNHLLCFAQSGGKSLTPTFVQHGTVYSHTGKALTNRCETAIFQKLHRANHAMTLEAAHVMLKHTLGDIERKKLVQVEEEMALVRARHLKDIETQLADLEVLDSPIKDFNPEALFETTPLIEGPLGFEIPDLPPDFYQDSQPQVDLGPVRRSSSSTISSSGLRFEPSKNLI